VDGVTTVDSADETTPMPVLDAREVPLELLAEDEDVRRMVTQVLENMNEPSQSRPVKFGSAI
jgi:hypothetical protein